MRKTVTFKTATQAAIFENELKGQISDGMWENTPNTSWQEWCAAEVQIGDNVGRQGFYPRKDNFAFTSKNLVEIIGDRMIAYARLVKVFGFDSEVDLRKLESAYNMQRDGTFKKVSYEGDYWKNLRKYVKAVGKKKVKAALNDTSYGEKELMADLREIKKAIKTRQLQTVVAV